MSTSRILRILAASSALLGLAAATPVLADANGVKIGVITDMSGSYADLSGKGSVLAAQMAVEEFGGKALGKPVTVLSADHQNKADIASSLARRWFDTDGVDMVIDFPNSSTALAVQEVARQKQKIDIVSTGGAMALTNQNCSPTGFHWAWDTYSVSYPLVRRLIDQGRNSWYYITVDYAFGQSLEADFRKAVAPAGARTWAAPGIRSMPAISAARWWLPQRPRPRSWCWPTPAMT